jgi:hypothetical protein
MKKILWILGICLVVLIVVTMMVGMFYLGPIVKIGLEQVGPRVTQVSLKVDSVDISLLTGSAAVKGFVLGNPTGYATPEAINVGTVAVKMDLLSVTSPKIVVQSVHVESPVITFEGGISNNNLTKIMGNVSAFSGNGSPAPAGTPAAASSNTPAPKIEVDDFLITGAKVHINISSLINKEIPLPDIHLTDLGKGSGGLTPAELSSAVLSAITSDTVSAVTSTVANLGQGVKSLGQTAVKTVGENVSKITSGLGGLLGK